MKILIAIPYFYPKVGGLENYALHIARGLKERFHVDIVVITSLHLPTLKQKEIYDGMTIYRLPILFKLSNTPIHPLWIRDIWKIIRKEKPHIIIGHTPVPYIADITGIVAKLLHIPFVLTYQNDLVKEGKIFNLLFRIYYVTLGRYLGTIAKNIIVSSGYYAKKSLFVNRFAQKTVVISPGVNLKTFLQYKKIKLTVKKPFALFVGQLDKTHAHKGLRYLIHAIEITTRKYRNFSLVVVGKGDNINYFQKLVQGLSIEKHVTFVGGVGESELVNYYHASDMVVLPSTTNAEGFGMVLIEAGICKKPVIGSRVGGIPYVIDDMQTGILVSPKDPVKLAKAITTLIKNPSLANKLGNNGYKKIVNNYSWKTQIEKTYTLLQQLI